MYTHNKALKQEGARVWLCITYPQHRKKKKKRRKYYLVLVNGPQQKKMIWRSGGERSGAEVYLRDRICGVGAKGVYVCRRSVPVLYHHTLEVLNDEVRNVQGG